jgi:hypothetical protein
LKDGAGRRSVDESKEMNISEDEEEIRRPKKRRRKQKRETVGENTDERG